MPQRVRLERLPESVKFPVELGGKVSYAPEARELRFEGFMSKTDFDKLARLSNDLPYQRALEKLFQNSSFGASDGPVTVNRKPVILAAVTVVALIGLLSAVWLFRGRPHDERVPQSKNPTHASLQSAQMGGAGVTTPGGGGLPAKTP